MICRSSSATKKKKFTTCSGWPANFFRKAGSCVAIPTGQVLRWHFRIMMQPSTIKRRGRKTELLGAQQGGDGDVAAGLQLSVGLDPDTTPQIVQHQRLMRFGQAQFPRDPART